MTEIKKFCIGGKTKGYVLNVTFDQLEVPAAITTAINETREYISKFPLWLDTDLSFKTANFFEIMLVSSSLSLSGMDMPLDELQAIMSKKQIVLQCPYADTQCHGMPCIHLPICSILDMREAIRFMFSLGIESGLNIFQIKNFHKFFRTINGQGEEFRTIDSLMGNPLKNKYSIFTEPTEINQNLILYNFAYQIAKDFVPPELLAANIHTLLHSIRPFIDGNGRSIRFLCDALLVQSGQIPVIISGRYRDDYMKYIFALRQEDTAMHKFSLFYLERLIETREFFIKEFLDKLPTFSYCQ